jgi:hypothetical protein
MAEASDQNGSDGEGRKLGERTGLDTPFVQSTKAVPEQAGATFTT